MKYTFHVIPHTHWDREWYMPFEHFRIRLVDLIDHLLALLERDPDFLAFHLDSQTIVLEDYLAIRPQRKAELEAHIRSGRISVGPWYQLNDNYLTSGEATIRSLLVGTRQAKAFGATHPIGYLPDQFGNISQLPQIFRGFGLDNAIFGRGYQLVNGRKMEFLWESPDGSTVTTSLMAFWYNNAQHFPADGEAGKLYLDWLRESMGKVSLVSHLLLMNGVDHLEAQEDLSAALAALRPHLPEGEQILHSTLKAYMDAVKAEVAGKKIELERHQGELREDRGGQILAGVLSTRMYLKQANHQSQQNLEKRLEPYGVFARLCGGEYPADHLLYAWKLLMQNHPHDSICGCSVDAVHDEMMTRFAKVDQLAEMMTARALRHTARQIRLDGRKGADAHTRPVWTALKGWPEGLAVFNALSWRRSDPVQVTLEFPLDEPSRMTMPLGEERKVRGFALLDGEGREVPCAVKDLGVGMREVYSPVELPMVQWVHRFELAFVAENVPACGYASYRIQLQDGFRTWPDMSADAGQTWQVWFEDGGDVGDEYLYNPPKKDRRITQAVKGELVGKVVTPVSITERYRAVLELPAGAKGTEERVRESVRCRAETTLTRWKGVQRVEYETVFDNQARDHRLRVVFSAPEGQRFAAGEHFYTDGQFDVIERPQVHPLAGEGAATFHPQQAWSALEGRYTGQGTVTAAVLNRGMPEIEVYQGAEGPQLALTLLRCVNYISRRGDGPSIETPGAQCLGEAHYAYAFTEQAGGWEEARIWQQAGQFNTPLAVAAVEGGGTGLPERHSFFELSHAELVLSALKLAEDVPGRVIARFYVPGRGAVEGAQVRLSGARRAWLTNLNEEPQEELALNAEGVATVGRVGSRQIVTVAFDLE